MPNPWKRPRPSAIAHRTGLAVAFACVAYGVYILVSTRNWSDDFMGPGGRAVVIVSTIVAALLGYLLCRAVGYLFEKIEAA